MHWLDWNEALRANWIVFDELLSVTVVHSAVYPENAEYERGIGRQH